MNVNEIIASGLLESYILGTSSDEENRLLNDLCKKHPELVKEIESIEASLIQASGRRTKPVDPALKEKIMRELSFSEGAKPSSAGKVVAIRQPENDRRLKLYRFAAAASLLLFIVSFAYNLLLQRRINALDGELAELSTDKKYMAQEMQVQQASLKQVSEQFHVISNPGVKTVALNGMNAMKGHQAMVHWNAATDEVYFNAAELPKAPADRQYQLWAIVEGKPVDIGMIDSAATSDVFQKMKAVKGAQAFAVTVEKMGGSPVPTMETMCLLGNV